MLRAHGHMQSAPTRHGRPGLEAAPRHLVSHIDWLANIEESLHPWDKAHLVMMYDLFSMLLDSVRI